MFNSHMRRDMVKYYESKFVKNQNSLQQIANMYGRKINSRTARDMKSKVDRM